VGTSNARTDDGRTVAGRYRLGTVIGRGGMGTVWRGEDTLLGRDVAVKEVELPSHLDADDRRRARARVLREARAAARLSHPASVTVYDVAEDDGTVHLVMELLEAPTLAEVVRSNGPLSPARAAEVGVELAGALAAAHREGIVHRDVKPSNVVLLPEGGVRLTDFGIASLKDDPSITATGMVMGSPSYMAPEQATGQTSGPAVDAWGLGATLYFAVEGEPPFARGEALPTMHAVVHDELEAPVRAGPLTPLLTELLAKDPAQRPAMDDAARRLHEVADGTGDDATAPAPAMPPPTATTVAPRVERTTPAPVASRRRSWLVPAVSVALLVALAAALLLARAGDEETPGQRPGAATASDDTGPDSASDDGEAGGSWREYTDEGTGYRIEYPTSWRVVRDGRRVDFRDPSTGAYLRVDWVRPPGSSPVAAWEEQSRSFAARYGDYRELRIEATTFKGMRAAEWEFTYAGQHAIDLGFVTDAYGFALNFQTPAGSWDELQPWFERFKDSFAAP
jgi:hypothetical protein